MLTALLREDDHFYLRRTWPDEFFIAIVFHTYRIA